MDSDEPEVLWITGYRATMVESGGGPPMSQEFMCHSKIDFDAKTHKMLFRSQRRFLQKRLFTISHGRFDITFPEGFSIPILSPVDIVTEPQ